MATKLNEGLTAPRPGVGWTFWERISLRRLALQLIPFGLAFAVYLGAFLVMQPEPTGDEPHYLMIAQSLAFDGDLDLANDYASRSRTLRVYAGFPLDTTFQAADYRGTGQLRPLHGVGLGAALAIPTGLWGETGARLAMILIAALLADQLFRLLRGLGLAQRYRLLAWIATVFCLPLIVFSSQIYTEVPCALILVVLLRIMIAGARRPVLLALGSTLCAALVWLHVRYLPLSAGAMLGLAIAAAGSGEPGVRALVMRVVGTLVRRWRTVTVPLVTPYLVGLVGLGAAFYHWYGSFNFKAPYAIWGDTTVGAGGWNFVYEFVLTDLFNPVAGWIPFAPVHWLGLAALGAVIVRFRWPAAGVVAVAAAYELLGASSGPLAAWQPPARYLLVVIPLIAVPITLVIESIRSARLVFFPLLAVSLLFAGAAVHQYQGLYPVGVKPRIFGARTTAPLFPITRNLTLSRLQTSFTLEPGNPPPQTGTAANGVVTAKPGDPRSYMLWGPYASLKEGDYRATFTLAATGVLPGTKVAQIEVAGAPPVSTYFARRVVKAGDVGPKPTKLSLDFKTPGGWLFETRVFYFGRGTVTAGPVKVEATRVAATPLWGFPEWALAAIWVGGTILVGWFFVRQMRRRPAGQEA